MAQLFVKPLPGRSPRHETTGEKLSPTGDWWPDSPYTRRRLIDRDIVVAAPQDSVSSALIQPQVTQSAAKTGKKRSV